MVDHDDKAPFSAAVAAFWAATSPPKLASGKKSFMICVFVYEMIM